MTPAPSEQQYRQASIKTAGQLRTIAQNPDMLSLSRLTLPEVDEAVDLVGRLVPAGNVPGVILSGLARLSGRQLPEKRTRRDVNMLFQGVDQMLDRAVYWGFFGGPAAVIWGYQQLLKLAGKDPEAAFPHGTWQFYVEYALREDSARHANETHGFDTTLGQHQITLPPVDRLTAWAMACIHALHQYDRLLENEWRERVYCRLLYDIMHDHPLEPRYRRVYRQWEGQRPYMRGQDVTATDDYPSYRRFKFDRFLAPFLEEMPDDRYQTWQEAVRQAEADELPAYQQQMSILAYLEPGSYGETRVPVPLADAQLGIIYQERYYLLAVCQPGTTEPPAVSTVRNQIAQVLATKPAHPPAQLTDLAAAPRTSLARLAEEGLPTDLVALNRTPVLINADQRPVQLPLADLRQAERGVGSHALTLFDTSRTMVFDQSHIFFDGAWGAALAEILTNEALSWAVYLHQLEPPQPAGTHPTALTFNFKRPAGLAPSAVEVAAETDQVNIKSILALRKLFKRRSDLLQLTVNDLLVLYRAIHAARYTPASALFQAAEGLPDAAVARRVQAALEDTTNPAILIPVDASQRAPRDRLYPMTFEVPLQELDLLALHDEVIQALDAYETAPGDRAAYYQRFDSLQRHYLAALAGFGAVMSRAKDIANTGASTSTGTIKLLAHMPAPLQRLLDKIPGQFEVLNDIIKGREVFSNVGAVAPSSTLMRFITAKDDNAQKTLAWGVITDASGAMCVSLRDFRPHVRELVEFGQRPLAQQIAQHYLDAYAHGLNDYTRDLRRITAASRETQAQ